LCTASGGCRAIRRARARQGHAEGAAAGEAYKAKLASANERDRLAVDLAVKEIAKPRRTHPPGLDGEVEVRSALALFGYEAALGAEGDGQDALVLGEIAARRT
jgi:hypothetical protein